MFDRGKIIILLIIFLALVLFPVWYQTGNTAVEPVLELSARAKEAGRCVEPKEIMQTRHMNMLDQWRNEVVREEKRYYTNSEGKKFYKSLQVTCMDCHKNKSEFCDRCHSYSGVTPSCWACHAAPKENI
jgi:hypothetical protein